MEEIYTPNLKDVLNTLKEKYDLFIVSNTAETKYIEAFLISSGTQNYFKDYIAASKLKISKSEAIKKVISENNIEKAVYIGDTSIDLEASKKSGIPFVQAKYGFGQDLKTKYSINQIDELPKILEEVFKV